MCNFFTKPIHLGEECPFCGEQRILRPVRINDIVWNICKLCEIDIFFIEEIDNDYRA